MSVTSFVMYLPIVVRNVVQHRTAPREDRRIAGEWYRFCIWLVDQSKNGVKLNDLSILDIPKVI